MLLRNDTIMKGDGNMTDNELLLSLSEMLDKKFDAHTEAIDKKLDAHTEAIDKKLDAHTEAIDKKLKKLDAHTEVIDKKFDEHTKEIRAEVREIENSVLEEVDRVDEKLQKKIDALSEDVKEIKEYYRINKSENENVTLLLKMIIDLKKEVDILKSKIA